MEKFFTMKNIRNIISMLAASVLAVSAQAGENIGWNNMDTSNAFLLQGGSGGNYFTAMEDASLTFSLSSLGISDANVKLGVYTFDSNGNVLSTTVFDDVSLDGSYSVDFSAGDNIAFWTEIDGIVIDSKTTSGGNYYGYLDNGQLFEGRIHVDNGDWSNYWNTVVSVTPGEKGKTPSGQPLPGVLLTAALGGTLLASKLRRKKV